MLGHVALRGLAWVTRHLRRMPGRWRLVRWLDRHAARLASAGPLTFTFAPGLRMHVDPLDENGRRALIEGFEPRDRIASNFIRILRPGDTVLDVGANAGYYTMIAALLVGHEGAVHAFEPSPAALPWLRASVAQSPSAPIHLHPVAVTDRCGHATFHVARPECTGYSSLRDLGADATRQVTVPTIPLDALLERLTPVRLVKIDVEGAELLVLRGMAGLIERDRPYIIVEVDDNFLRAQGGSAADVCSLLEHAGYTLLRIVERGDLEPLDAPPIVRCNLLAQPPAA